jgi:hypothetical protein
MSGTGTPAVLVARVEPVPVPVLVRGSVAAWIGTHSAAWGSCRAMGTGTDTDMGISPCSGLAQAWAWAQVSPLAETAWVGIRSGVWGSCTATLVAGSMDMGTDRGISPYMAAPSSAIQV